MDGRNRPGRGEHYKEPNYRYNSSLRSGFCYGSVAATNDTININRLGATDEAPFLDKVTVIWTATPANGGRVIVGWYRNARIFRKEQRQIPKGRGVLGYNVRARAEDAVLVPEEQRRFQVPHGKKGEPLRPVFYPDDSDAPSMRYWLSNAISYISSWTGNSV